MQKYLIGPPMIVASAQLCIGTAMKLAMSKGRTYYDILGVSPDAEPAVIEAAYRALIKKYHPDRNSGGADRSAALNEAFSVLRDPRKRMEYDRQRGIDSTPPSMDVRDREQATGNGARATESTATKECPDCGETVRGNARVCRFCGYEFWSDEDSLEPEPETTPPRGVPLWKPLAAIGGLLFLLWLLAFCSYTPETQGNINSTQAGNAASLDMNTTDENASIDVAQAARPVAAQWTAYDQAESNLTATYRALMAQLPPKERLDLRTGERAWIANRNRVCGFETRGECATTWTASRAQQLDRQWVERFMPHVGDCFSTTVAHVGPRLEGDSVEDSAPGASVAYQDGHYQVDYESSPTALGFNVGDAVHLCVVDLPRGCPPGDHRGIDYEATDLVTGRTFRAADSEHECGGA